ncbi:hypothetical protein D3C77_598560 [compost metagenome]
MKSFDRFTHHGVLSDLSRIKSQFIALDGMEAGSSGDGELTLRYSTPETNVTAYVRKYRDKEGWRVVFCRRGKEEEKHYSAGEEEVVRLLEKQFS